MPQDSTTTLTPSEVPVSETRRLKKEYISVSGSQWLMDTLFMLSLSLTGLGMPLGNLLVIVFLVQAWRNDREGFIVKLTLTLGGYALSMPKNQWGINLVIPMTIVAVFAMLVLRKSPRLKLTLWLYAFYALSTLVLVFVSDESFANQWRTMLGYLAFGYFAIVLLSFAGESFDIHRFWQRLFSLQIIICIFYVIDAFVLRGWVLIPCSFISMDSPPSTWLHPIFRNSFPRKYPPGLYPMVLLLYPMARYYKMRVWQWAVVLLSLQASETFTVTTGLVFGYILSLGTMKKFLLYAGAVIGMFGALYAVDASMGYDAENEQSTMRIASSINQFLDISKMEDDEDLAKLGTSRMAQAIPRVENIYEVGKIWTGFGFIPFDTRDGRFIIENELATLEDESDKYVNCVEVEISAVFLFLELGYIGLGIHIFFLIALWGLVKKLDYSREFLVTMVTLLWFGIGGFSSWMYPDGVYLGALAFAVVILANKERNRRKHEPSSPELCPQPTTNA